MPSRTKGISDRSETFSNLEIYMHINILENFPIGLELTVGLGALVEFKKWEEALALVARM